MGLKTEKLDKILELFYEYPRKKFTIREIAKSTKIPKSTIQNYVKALKKKELITKDNQATNSLLFKFKKIHYFIERIIKSGLIEELVQKLNPTCIILFGSIRKGDSVKESDIDLFVESSIKKEIILKRYEKILKHNIQLFVYDDIDDLQPHLFNNVVNGIKLYGSFKVK